MFDENGELWNLAALRILFKLNTNSSNNIVCDLMGNGKLPADLLELVPNHDGIDCGVSGQPGTPN